MADGMTEEDVYNYLLGLEDVGGFNPYQNLFVNITVDVNDNIHTPNSYLGRDNMYFPDIYEDVEYRSKLREAIANTKSQIMQMIDMTDDFDDTQDLLDTLDSLDHEDLQNKRLNALRNELSELQGRLDMSLGNEVNEDAKKIIQINLSTVDIVEL